MQQERTAGKLSFSFTLILLILFLPLSFSSFSLFFFFLVTYCRVECNFLTLKISGWGAPTFRRDRRGAEVDADDALRVGMTWKMKESKSKREGRRKKERKVGECVCVCVCVCRVSESEKKSRPERKDYIGDFGFRVSSGRKADFPIFRLSRDESRHSN